MINKISRFTMWGQSPNAKWLKWNAREFYGGGNVIVN